VSLTDKRRDTDVFAVPSQDLSKGRLGLYCGLITDGVSSRQGEEGSIQQTQDDRGA